MATREELIAYARKAASKNGVDPDIFTRQIQQESGFNPGAYNKKSGATGIAQIMPGYHPDVNPRDPLASLDYAARLMASHLKDYGGRYDLALAAYNAGPGNVQKYGGVPPFEETQTYVRNILGAQKETGMVTPYGNGDGDEEGSGGGGQDVGLLSDIRRRQAELDAKRKNQEAEWSSANETAAKAAADYDSARARASSANASVKAAEKALSDAPSKLRAEREEALVAARAEYQQALAEAEDAKKRAAEAGARRQRAEQEIKAIDSAYRQAQGSYDTTARAEAARAAARAQAEAKARDFLTDQNKLIEAGLASGRYGLDVAREQWDQQLQMANAIINFEIQKATQGASMTKQGYDTFLQGAGRMGTQADADALAETMKGWGPILGREVTPVQMGVQPFDPRGDMARYAPPAPDWQAAQQALMGLQAQAQPMPQGYGGVDVPGLLQQAQADLAARQAQQQAQQPFTGGQVGTGGPPGGPLPQEMPAERAPEATPEAAAQQGQAPMGPPASGPAEAPPLPPGAFAGEPSAGIGTPSFATLPTESQDYVRNQMAAYLQDSAQQRTGAMQAALTAGGAGQPRPFPGERKEDYMRRLAAMGLV